MVSSGLQGDLLPRRTVSSGIPTVESIPIFNRTGPPQSTVSTLSKMHAIPYRPALIAALTVFNKFHLLECCFFLPFVYFNEYYSTDISK